MVPFVVHIVTVEGNKRGLLGRARNSVRVTRTCHAVRATCNDGPRVNVMDRVIQRRALRRSRPCLPIQGVRHMGLNVFVVILCHSVTTLVRREHGDYRPLNENVGANDRDLRTISRFEKGGVRLTRRLCRVNKHTTTGPVEIWLTVFRDVRRTRQVGGV